MGMGHQKSKQSSFFSINWKHQLSHGGVLRKKQLGRGSRPLSTKEPIHAVFKVERRRLRHKSLRSPQSFKLVLKIIEKYSKYFVIKIEQLSVQNDHVHLIIRTTRRRQFHHFFRVVAGQIAQKFEKEGLLAAQSCQMTDTPRTSRGEHKYIKRATESIWKYRPFTRVVRGWKAYQTVKDYIQLNEKEIRGDIRYQKNRLSGLSSADWQILWA